MAEVLLLDTVEKLWRILGFNLKKPMGFINNIYILIACLINCVVGVLGAMVMFSDEFDLNALADIFECCGPSYQLLSKIVISRYLVGTIKQLLNLMEDKFWPVDKFDEAIKEKQLKLYRIVKFGYKSYCYVMGWCGIMICIRPLFLEKKRYPLASYNIIETSNTPYYIMMYSFQVFDLVYGITAFFAVDGLFVVFVLNILCQVIMLKHAFKSLTIGEISNDEQEKRIKIYVDHHNVIFEVLHELNKLYSIQLFNQFIGNTASLCMGIYITTAPGAEISAQIRSSLIIVTFTLEMAIYCIGGTLLTETVYKMLWMWNKNSTNRLSRKRFDFDNYKCLQVADAMYMSGWEKVNRKPMQFATCMIIMRSQKQQNIRAGGLIDINVVTLVSILQSSFSFYTLMNKATKTNL